ncbi:hypothetical protein TRFO_08790 [Tritrichomonas foetus]|uniref:TPR Domain containing protein n=1 Tax=Tritrichomonas foetus TaxID=1144522 RepID=A0A1J4JIL7_9EUKA|nr:hypothetical protein TRFO_08790 [Tritrichomonas foetus]|eukprot:OHS98529.1 hypothetical protein TRFO_08790 [Tritrichomonas foetus]
MSRQVSARNTRQDGNTSARNSARLTKREAESSSHRLSRAPQRYSNAKAQIDKNDTYAVSYFKNNPDAVIDTRPPEAKLEELDCRLSEYDLETSDKFTYLIHQKSLNYIVYGENSIESLRSHAALGAFYNENHRPLSALRHLQKALSLQQTNSIERNELITLNVEIAEAHLALRNDNRQESLKQIQYATEALKDILDDPIEDDARLRYRRDLAKARISAAKGKFEQALSQYEIARNSLEEANDNEDTNVTAKLYVEMAETAEAAKNAKKSGDYYSRAYETFIDLGMEESAAVIQPKVPQDNQRIDSDDDIKDEY